VSKACTSICMWVRAMYVYHNVALQVGGCLRVRVCVRVRARDYVRVYVGVVVGVGAHGCVCVCVLCE